MSGAGSCLLDEAGAVLLERVEVAERLWPRFAGLMGRASLPRGCGVHFPRCRSVHTFFMRFPIDVVFLDDGMRVVGIRRAVRPWGVVLGPAGTRSILETAPGAWLREPVTGGRVRIAAAPGPA